MSIVSNLSDLIGNTPLLKLQSVSKETGVEILGKCEFLNPTGSVKDRAAASMIAAAEKEGRLDPDTVIIEPTSGNTGISLAAICSMKGYRLIITMPDSMSLERRNMLKALGAELELTPGHLQMDGAISRAEALQNSFPKTFIPQQFNNAANPKAHYDTTGPEIWADLNGDLDAFVAAVGTGGTLSGVGKYLKEQSKEIRVVAVEPEDSAVLSGKKPGPHMIQGIGAGFVPTNLDRSVIDEIVTVSNDEAMAMTRKLAKDEGVFVGVSAGANVAAAVKLAKDPKFKGKRIVTILCDIGDRYLSTTLFREAT